MNEATSITQTVPADATPVEEATSTAATVTAAGPPCVRKTTAVITAVTTRLTALNEDTASRAVAVHH